MIDEDYADYYEKQKYQSEKTLEDAGSIWVGQ